MERIQITEDTLKKSLQTAAASIARGGLVIYPTETLYGVAVDAENLEAVSKLLKFKTRPAGKAISVLVASKDQAAEYVHIEQESETIFTTLLPGPVTVVCKDKGKVDPRLLSELGTLGIRISSHPVAMALSIEVGKAITATSANAAGKPRPYTVERMLDHLSKDQIGLIDVILDFGPLPKREPSTVIDTTTPVQTVLRAGAAVELLQPGFLSESEENTRAYAEQLMRSFQHVLPEKTLIFALEGTMGMGKTRFAQGVAKGLMIERPVSSPSFTLMKEYQGLVQDKAVTLLHMDLWRAENITAEEIGLSEYLKPHTVLVIEWPQPLLDVLANQEDVLVQRVRFEEIGPESRSIQLIAL